MIPFIDPKRGTNTVGLVCYLFGPGRANEHTDQRVIAADLSLGILDGTRLRHEDPGDWREIIRLGKDLDAHRKVREVVVPKGHVWHCSFSLPPEDSTPRKLTDAQWAEVARTAVRRMGFTAGGGKAPCRWLAVGHGLSVGGNDHIHLVVNLVREDGQVAGIQNDRWRMQALCRELEERFGLRVVEGRFGAGMPGVSRAEMEIAARAGRAEPARRTLARAVRGCAVAARDEADFVQRLRGLGVLARPRYGKGGRAEVVGYSVAAKPGKGGGHRPVWFGGGKLARDLTLPRLREHWEGRPEHHRAALAAWQSTKTGTRSGRPPATYRTSAWEQAAHAVEQLTTRLAEIPVDDAAAWAGAAREASGVLSAWSARLEADRPGALAYAADSLARSAQTRYGHRRAYRHPAASDLRGVAMVVFSAGRETRGHVGQVILLRQLTRLLGALHDLQRARGQAGHAAARAAAARERLIRLHTTLAAQPAPRTGQPAQATKAREPVRSGSTHAAGNAAPGQQPASPSTPPPHAARRGRQNGR